MTEGKEYYCPVDAAMDEIGSKWKLLILGALKDSKLRFCEINRVLVTITQRMLTKQLRELKSDNLVNRNVYPEILSKVECSLTEKGKSILPILEQLCEWGKEYCY